MAVSNKQLNANRINAQKSTGPVTAIGKKKVSVNAVTHGVLSNKLTLPDESEDEYQKLLNDLIRDRKATGTLELVLVEKIAVNLWRQRRLNNAETAQISLQTQPRYLAQSITRILNCCDNPVTITELESTDEEHIDWYKTEMSRYENLESSTNNWSDLEHSAPDNYQRLLKKIPFSMLFENSNDCIVNYFGDFDQCLENLVVKCQERYQRRPKVLQLAELVKAEKQILHGEDENNFTRYQTSLNNELHKLIKTLQDLKKMQPLSSSGEVITIEQK